MGVPRFAPWITNRVPKMVLRELQGPAAGLYVDVNGVIHPFCHGEGVDSLPEEEKIQNILQYLDKLVSMTQPTEVVYLAVDGVAPRAKMNQQRARRYMSSATCITPSMSSKGKENTEAHAVSTFDSNAISPGTAFMERVTAAIQKFIREKIASRDPLWGKLSVFLSDSNVPSEGEHKLIKFLRGQSESSSFFKGSHVIVGLDADLVFLSLALHVPNIFIMREQRARPTYRGRRNKQQEDKEKTYFEYFSVDIVGESLITDIYQLSKLKGFQPRVPPSEYCSTTASGYKFPVPKLTPENEDEGFHPCMCPFNSKIIDDFVVMGFFVGNDFMSRLPSAYCGESALDHLLECYIDAVLPYGFLTGGPGEINPKQLERFFTAYAQYEKRLFVRAHVGDDTTVLSDEEANARWETLCETYYRTTKLGAVLDQACEDYLHTMAFVWRYYSTMMQVDWKWYYPHHHSPFAKDLAAFLQKKPSMNFPTPEINKPCDKLVQLLSILPPRSAPLVPPVCRPLLQPGGDNDHVVEEWSVDFTGAMDEDHLAAVLLPFVDLAALERRFESIRGSFSALENKLNENTQYHRLYHASDATDVLFLGSRIPGDTEAEKGEEDGVVCEAFLEMPPATPRPRMYSYKAPIHNVYNEMQPSHSADHIQLIDFVVACCLFSIALVLFLKPSLTLLLQVFSQFAFVIIIIYLLGLAARTPGNKRTGISRVKTRRAFVNWICASCNEHNYERQNVCFFCGAPCNSATCKAFFTSKFPQDAPKLWDANHAANFRTYRGAAFKDGECQEDE